MFMEGYDQNNMILELIISNVNNIVNEVTISAPKHSSNYQSRIQLSGSGDTKAVAVSNELRMVGTSRASRGVLISATGDINVALHHREASNCGGTLLYPVDALGTEYSAMTWWPFNTNDKENSQIGIVATQDNTEVRISFPTSRGINVQYDGISYNENKVLLMFLNKYDTVQLQDDNMADLTATKILSLNYKIGVFSGNIHTDISSAQTKDMIVEQMPPMYAWGREFAVIPTLGRTNGDKIKVLAKEDSTYVTISGVGTLLLKKAGDYDERTIPSGPYVSITATRPILAAQFTKSQLGSDDGQPAMSILIPRQQFQHSYTFGSPTNTPANYQLLLVSEWQYYTGLLLDGQQLNPNDWQTVPTLNPAVVGKVISISGGNHIIASEDDNARFAAYLYGHYPDVCAFFYPIGTCLDDTAQVCWIQPNIIYL